MEFLFEIVSEFAEVVLNDIIDYFAGKMEAAKAKKRT